VSGPGDGEVDLPYLARSQAHKLVHIALVTYHGVPRLSADDQLLLAPLAARGISAVAAAWDDPGIAWDSFDALVLRSTWNYHTSLGEFTAWIDRIESLGVPVWNPPAVLRWNATKTYLRELAARGVDIVPTRWVTPEAHAGLADLLADVGWPDAVVKPAVSASAYETWRVDAAGLTRDDEERFRRIAARPGGALVQRFVPELARDGEWSLMFLAGQYSHAVLKRPRAGDFRVQREHGGTAVAQMPPTYLVAAAQRVVAAAPGPLLYARVDGCAVDGRFVLVELELLEPSLFLAADGGAPERFAAAIAGALGRA
jgi:glutathione synthase/RimK-type ligase-like ATP-grasp enzyme